MAEIDRCILAKIRNCKDTTILEGAACTNRCEFFNNCEIKRTPFLIQAENNKIKLEGRREEADNIIVVSDSLISRTNDEYINILFEEAE